jgi:AraC-like DNA-binding protein
MDSSQVNEQPTGARGATYSSRVISGWLEHAREEGISIDTIRDQVGLDAGTLADPDARIRWRVVEQLLEELVPRTDGLMPFRYVTNVRRGQLGMVGFVVRHSPTLDEALERMRRFWRINNQLVRIEIDRGDTVTFHGRFLVPVAATMQRFSSQLFTGHVVSFARRVCGRDWDPVEVRLPFAAPPEADAYREHFRGPVTFDAERSAVVLRPEDVARPVAGADPVLAAELTRYAEMLLAKLPEVGAASSRVRRLLIEMMPDDEPRVETVARAMALSSRSLQRQLRTEGTSFSKLLDDVRHQLALQHLDQGRTVEEVTFVLGFSHTAAFQRAFKRWAGMSPRQYKKRRG